MKKSTVRVVIVAIIMTGIGLGMFVGGILAVGGFTAAKGALEENGIYIDRGFRIDINRSRGTTASEKIHSDGSAVKFGAEDVRSLEIEAGAAQVEIIQKYSADEVTVQTDSNCDIYVKNTVLHVETDIDFDECSIMVEIPSNAVFEEVNLSGSACKMYVEYLETKELDLEVDAGQVIIADLTAENTHFEIGAGELIIEHANVEELDANVGMGNFEYDGQILKRGSIDCGMGNAELYLEGAEEDYNYEIDCAAGNVQIGERSYGGVATERTIDNGADSLLDIECGMGNVTIDF